MTIFEVLFGGAETTVQDAGAQGWLRKGISPSGAQDNYSFCVGNILLKNPENAAALEIAVVGPRLMVREDTVVAFTGADIPPKVNGREVEQWKTIAVRSGDVISFGTLRSGCRSYLCVAGGIDVPANYGCRSTRTLSRIGGYKGRKLEKGDQIETFRPEFPLERLQGISLAGKYVPPFPKEARLRVVLGMYHYLLTAESAHDFLNSKWTIMTNANRVAYYLKGCQFSFKPIPPAFGAGSHPSNVVDIPYPIGSVQVPGGQHAVMLMNDGVTGGGFAIIATVVRPDLDLAWQLKPGDAVFFQDIGIAEASRIRKEKEFRISEVKKSLRYSMA